MANMKDAVMELEVNTSLYSGGPNVTISERAARGVLRYISYLENKKQKQQEAVVRCKDCKYYNSLMGHCKDGRSYPSPEWYCADAELKDEWN